MRIVLGEDSVLLREGIARLLGDAGFEVVAQAGDAEDLLRKVRAHKPDVAIVDIRMPPTHTDEGLRAALMIRRELPNTAVLVLSSYVQEEYAVELLGDSAEGVGYLLKDRVADVERFIDSIRRVAAGGSALDPEVVSQMLGRRRAAGPLNELTPREREVLALMAEGRSNHAIAAELVITDRAVEKHVTSIFGKLNLSSTADDHRRGARGASVLRLVPTAPGTEAALTWSIRRRAQESLCGQAACTVDWQCRTPRARSGDPAARVGVPLPPAGIPQARSRAW